MPYRVYLLMNAEGRSYVGLSENVARRLDQHNVGVSNWTRSRGPWRLCWQSEEMNLSEARGLERLLKRQKGGDGLYRLTGLRRDGS
ncbi:MAG: GIY-YIG nuclease family protein [Opitutaceae bacterium]